LEDFNVTVISSVKAADVSTADFLFFLHFISMSKYCTIGFINMPNISKKAALICKRA
jgi:hypothetical protein